ncbi:hypothetical protein HQ45_01590 [Porphyromonas crevioricanis]|uniref:Uncharacterized protein n=1 Tax=Porphyromonas crevioricanis TaxID=393921 RepID=A0A0A2FL49_9PORP|nr:hypothetical protein HQ45_01590 [Porphyromonas crevioricanis]SQH73226.1 Uncharacterised protein [Porphyromonas crevioricanis]
MEQALQMQLSSINCSRITVLKQASILKQALQSNCLKGCVARQLSRFRSYLRLLDENKKAMPKRCFGMA